jgi:quercetin dioxygenase-like cupin family protein
MKHPRGVHPASKPFSGKWIMPKPQSILESAPIDLEYLVEEMQRDEVYHTTGHSARTLVRVSDLRVALVAMRAKTGMSEHEARESLLIHTLSGRVCVLLPEQSIDVRSGCLLSLGAGTRHAVDALEDSVFLLTLGWPSEGPRDA